MSRVVVLDGEAVQAVASTAHPHHRQAIAIVQVVADRKRRSRSIRAVVPSAVRVEADLDRRTGSAAFFNALRIEDRPLDGPRADVAADLHATHGVSVPDAHVGAVIAAVGHTDVDVTVVTSDPRDMRRVAGDVPITVVKL